MATPKKPASKRATRTPAQLKADLQSVISAPKRETDRVSEELREGEISRIRTSLSGLTADKLTVALATNANAIQQTFATLQGEIANAFQNLTDIREAITFEREELERLHGAEVVASSIEELVRQYDSKTAYLEAAYSEKEKELDQRIAEARANEILRTEETNKNRRREDEQYLYNINRQRTLEKEKFDDEMRLARKKFAEEEEANKKSFAERAAALAAQEKEVSDLRVKVANFPDELEKAVNARVAIATSSLKKDLNQEFALKEKDLQTSLTLAQARATAAESAKEVLAQEIVNLHAKIEAAQARVSDIAKAAVDSASGQVAMQKMAEMATSPGNGRSSKQS